MAAPTFLARLKSLYPPPHAASYLQNPWYLVAAVAYTASNRPEAVQDVFRHALRELDASAISSERDHARLMLVRKIRDGIFKAGLSCGYPKAINGLLELYRVTPPELQDKQPLRDTTISMDEQYRRGFDMFKQMYGNTSDEVGTLLNNIYPDFWYFCNAVGYGLVYSYDGALSPAETSFAILAAQISTDTPRQIAWQLDNAVRNGATMEQVRAVRQMTIEVAESCAVKWRDGVPDLNA